MCKGCKQSGIINPAGPHQGYCQWCTYKRKEKRNAARRDRDQARRDCGLVRVKGNLGGIYWE